MILNYIHWNPDPEIINIFGISIRYYGLLFISGLILCIYILGWIYKRESIPSENLEKLTIYGMIGIIAGARLGHCLFYEPSYYLSHPLEMILPITFPPTKDLIEKDANVQGSHDTIGTDKPVLVMKPGKPGGAKGLTCSVSELYTFRQLADVRSVRGLG